MSSLFGLLDLGSAALQAHNAGIAVASNNVANASTPGYSRQRIDLRSQLASPLVGGVRAGGVERMASGLLAQRMRQNAAAAGTAHAFTSGLLELEQGMSAQGASVSSQTGALFGALGHVSAAPLDTNLRNAAVAAAEDLAQGIRRQAQAAEDSREQANLRIREQVQEANRYIQEIALANRAAAQDADPVALDRRDMAAQKLAELTGAQSRVDADGHMRVTLANGESLVDGTRGAQLTATPDAALGGMDRISVVDGTHTRDVTTAIDSGLMGGDLRMRDQQATGTMARLDQLAFDLATEFNAVHRSGAGLDGVSGRDMFTAPTQVAGAAAAFAVDPALVADSTLLATAAAGAGPGDNQGVTALVALGDQTTAGGGRRTFLDEAIDITAQVGRTAAAAGGELELFNAEADHLAGLRDSESGVSLQEETMRLSQFQHASEAQVRFLSTIDELLGTMIESL